MSTITCQIWVQENYDMLDADSGGFDRGDIPNTEGESEVRG